MFDDSSQAREWEHKVLRRLKVVISEKWLNRHDPKGVWFREGDLSIETRNKLKKPKKDSSKMGRYKRTPEIISKQNVGNWRSVKWLGENNPAKRDSQRQKSRELMKALRIQQQSYEFRAAKSEKRKGKTPVFNLVDKTTSVIPTEIFYSNRDEYISTRSKEYKLIKEGLAI